MCTEQQQADHRRHEVDWLRPFTDTIPGWDTMRYTQRMLAREGKQFQLWYLDDNMRPVVLDRFTVTGLQVDRSGPNMLVQSDFGNPLSLGPAPQQLLNHRVFLWVPAFFDARYAPFNYESGNPLRRDLSWRFCVKMLSNPAVPEHRKVGQVYFTEVPDLRRLWPDTTF